MKRQVLHPDVEAIYNRVLSRAEIAAFRAAPVTQAEIEATLELVRWFTTRYSTAAERFAYNRRAYARAVARTGLR